MRTHVFGRIADLERGHASFAIATVVARQSPVSSHLGDRALVFANGRMEGFVGGSCSRDIVRRHALAAIRTRQPVLLQIRNAASAATGTTTAEEEAIVNGQPRQGAFADSTTERVVIPMSCASEGAVDVYIEPRVPARRLVVIGFTPVAEALAQLASTLDYEVVRVVVAAELRDLTELADVSVLALTTLHEFLDSLGVAERAALIAIVASQGHYDELALEVLQKFDVAFVGLLASRRRAATVFGVLAQQGVPAERLAMIRNPVGLDIGARSPGEVAVSILAEIIENMPAAAGTEEAGATSTGAPSGRSDAEVSTKGSTAVDPVCGMDVETPDALYYLERGTETYFFCCAGCRASFAAEPARYLVALGST